MTARAPTLLVFTLSPARECARRKLLPARLVHLERALHRRNLEAALAAGRDNGCRLEVSSPGRLELDADVRQTPQRGRSFGPRFRAALRACHARAKGGPVLVVGSDVPGLSGDHVASALARLGDDPGRVVVGPSPDGGFYLLASHRPLDRQLARVHWCRGDTLDTLLAALRSDGFEVTLLEPLRDLDRARDLARWLAAEAASSRRWRSFAGRLLRTLATGSPSRAARPPSRAQSRARRRRSGAAPRHRQPRECARWREPPSNNLGDT